MFATPNKKTNALYPDVRETNCLNHHWHYTGNMPCSGSVKCGMCGLDKINTVTLKQLVILQHEISVTLDDLNAWECDYATNPSLYIKEEIVKSQELLKELLEEKEEMMQKHLISESGRELEMFTPKRELTKV